MKYDYTIDDKPYTWNDFIKQAREYGYDPGAIATTSGAASYLRKIGHEVGVYEEE